MKEIIVIKAKPTSSEWSNNTVHTNSPQGSATKGSVMVQFWTAV